MLSQSSSRKPAWLRVLDEISASQPPDFDGVRRKKLAKMQQYTNHAVIVHASACTVPSKLLPPQAVMMDFADIKAFETASDQLPPGPLDIILHTPGGIAEAVEGIVRVLRPKFHPIRFIVPHIAKSAGTMLALSGNEILLHSNGELGPIDPQMIVGNMVASAHAILSQFEQIKDEILGNQERGIEANPQKITLWGPILGTMGPALLVQCENARRFGMSLIEQFMTQYMFAGDPLAQAKAEGIAKALDDYNRWLSHGRRVGLEDLRRLSVHAKSLDDDPELAEIVDEVWGAVDFALANTPTIRITENHLGHATIRLLGRQPTFAIQVAPPGPQPPQPPPASNASEE